MKFGPNPAWTPIVSQFGSHFTYFSPTRGHSEPHTRGKMTSELAENWCPRRIWHKLHHGVLGGIPKKIWAGLLYSTQNGTELGLNHVDIYFASACQYRLKFLLDSVDKMWSGKWGS